MKITSKRLDAIATAIYGPDWRIRLAERLNVAERTVRRWDHGERDIPQSIAPALASLCRHRATQLVKMAEQLET